jgi:hypoxanthine phosphoribosyltransferase
MDKDLLPDFQVQIPVSGVLMRTRITPLVTEAQIRARVQELGAQLTKDYAGKDLVVIGLLNGVFPFFADLVRAMDLDIDVSFMQVASYGGGMESTGEVHILKDLDRSIQGRHALVVEDIVDTGLTLFKVGNLLKDREPLSLKICTLLDKPSRRKVEVPVDYIGFTIEDHFVVGYGLDLDGKLRNLPYVGVYHP